MNKDCSICGNEAKFKIKGENIYYCAEHSKEFFEEDCLENLKKIELGQKQAEILKKYLEKYF